MNRSSSGLQRARVPSVSSERSDRVPWRYGDARSHDPLRQFYEQDGHTSRTSQDTPPGYRQTGVGCRDYSTIDADGVDVDTIDMENVAATQHQNCSLGHHCCGDDVRLCTLPHHYITSASQDSRTPLSFGQLVGLKYMCVEVRGDIADSEGVGLVVRGWADSEGVGLIVRGWGQGDLHIN